MYTLCIRARVTVCVERFRHTPAPPAERLPKSRGCSPLLRRFSGLFARLCAASVPDSAHLRCQKDWRTSYFS